MKKIMLSIVLAVCSCLIAFAQSVSVSDATHDDGSTIIWMIPPESEVEFARENNMTLRTLNFHFKNMDKFDSDRIYHGKKAFIINDEAMNTIDSIDADDFWCCGIVHMFKKSDDIAVGDKTNSQWLDEKVDGWISILYPGKFQ